MRFPPLKNLNSPAAVACASSRRDWIKRGTGAALAWGLASSRTLGDDRQWPVEYVTGQFRIHSDVEDLDVRGIETELTAVADDVSNVLQIRQSDVKVHVVLFGTEREYQRYMRAYFPQLPQRRALFIQDRGPGMLFAHWSAQVGEDLRHEVAHALINASGQELPLWLDEGIAEYFEAPSGNRFAGSGHLKEVVQRTERGWIPRLDELDQIDALADFTTAHYRDSWSWIHFMLHRNRPARRILVRYLSDVRSGAEAMPLAKQLRRLIPNLDTEYQTHFSHFDSSALASLDS